MATTSTLELLRWYESRNVTFIEEDGSWPIVWERAKGVYVWDEHGSRYLDLTAAFGVAAAGHCNPRVVQAGRAQMGKLLHAMGDVHPHRLKAQLARELSRITFERWGAGAAKTIFGNSGFEAVEAALKTAMLATGRSKVIAFEGAYHGLGYGALNATHREHFRGPFRSQLREFGVFHNFPKDAIETNQILEAVGADFKSETFAAVLIEPIQARGGIRIPPPDFLPALGKICKEHNVLLVLDEIYTGFGRTGQWFACEHSHLAPDIICLGKALTGGFPLSACVGRSDLMDAAWPKSSGEAIHTSTFLGHPVGCAMALANIHEIERHGLVEKSKTTGQFLLNQLLQLPPSVNRTHLFPRGAGLMVGLELLEKNGAPATSKSLQLIKALLHAGFIFLPEGEHSNVVSFTPPLSITERQLTRSVEALYTKLNGLPSL